MDLRAEFPDVLGFSVRNLWNMKKWYSFYSLADGLSIEIEKIRSAVSGNVPKLQQAVAELSFEKLQQPVVEIDFPDVFAYVSWGQHIAIITKCKSVDEALLYIQN